MSDSLPAPERVTAVDLTEWLKSGWQITRGAPLHAAWLALAVLVPLAALSRFAPPLGWMIALVVAPVFAGGVFRYEALRRAGAPVSWRTVFEPWYAPKVRKALLSLGGFLAVAGVVAVGVLLSIVGGGALMLAQGTADGSDPSLALALLLVAAGAAAAAVTFVGFVFAVPLIASRPCGPMEAIAASAAACRANPLVAASLAALVIAMVLLALPTLGLSVLVGLPALAFALAEGTRHVFPEPPRSPA